MEPQKRGIKDVEKGVIPSEMDLNQNILKENIIDMGHLPIFEILKDRDREFFKKVCGEFGKSAKLVENKVFITTKIFVIFYSKYKEYQFILFRDSQ